MNNFLKNVASFFLICGFLLFWYIKWYWVIASYNIVFSYLSFTIFKDYNDNPKFRNKIPFFVYVGLPLALSFIGFLISIINGFEEISDEEIMNRKNINNDDIEKVFKRKAVESSSLNKFNH